MERGVFAAGPRRCNVESEVKSANPMGKISNPRIYSHVARRLVPDYWQLVPVKFSGKQAFTSLDNVAFHAV